MSGKNETHQSNTKSESLPEQLSYFYPVEKVLAVFTAIGLFATVVTLAVGGEMGLPDKWQFGLGLGESVVTMALCAGLFTHLATTPRR